MDYFDYCENILEKTPCVEQAIKTGNKAFRQWLEKVNRNKFDYISKLSESPGFDRAISELSFYIDNSFGSMEDIAYGTFNELNFVLFLFCLFKTGILYKKDLKLTINLCFARYLEIC